MRSAEPVDLAAPLESVVAALRRQAERRPDHVALVARGISVSYGQLWLQAMAAAGELRRSGVRPGDRVLLAAPSDPAFAIGYIGCHLAGGVAVLVDPLAPESRRDDIIARSAPRVAFGGAEAGHPVLGRIRSIAELAAAPAAAGDLPDPPLDALADLIFTTGTTGRPKGVQLSFRNLAAAARHINTRIGNGPDDIEAMPLPLFHSFGLGRLRCNVIAGGTVVLVDVRLPGELFEAMRTHRATGLVGVPSLFAMLLRFGAKTLPQFADSLRYIEIGSAAMPLDHKRQLMKILPHTALWMHYGLTEASRSTFLEFHRHEARLETAGSASPGVRLSVRTEAGDAVTPGTSGMLWIAGEHVSPGYWEDEELTARTFVDGWVRSGDVAHLDAEGFVHLHGRADDMINVGGFNVSPDEVERVLCTHPGIADAGCVGMEDPRKIAGRVVRAHLVVREGATPPTDAELRAWLHPRLEWYKIPVAYVWVNELPRTGSGKLLRAKLRD